MISALASPSSVHPDNRSTPPIPRDRFKRPLIRVDDVPKLVPYTRCTTFIDCLDDKTALSAWGKRMVLHGATLAPDLVEQARVLDPSDREDKRHLNLLVERLIAVAGAHDKRERGSHLHVLSEYVDRGEPIPSAAPEDLLDMAAYKIATVSLDIVHVERLVVVDELRVAGTPDRICFYQGAGPDGTPISGNLIADLKTGSMEYGALKMAMQLAVYSRGVFYDHIGETRSPLPQVNQDWGLILHLPAGSAACEVHWIDLRIGWEAVQVARQVRETRRKRNVLIPFSPHTTTAPPLAQPKPSV